jgi:hypothetical protein
VKRSGRRTLTWWIGLLFVIGSTCFLVGPIPVYASAVGGRAVASTFFVGSLFFTMAAYLSYAQVVRQGGHRWLGWEPRRQGFWAASIQLVGTLFFNVSTFAALLNLPAGQYDDVVWQPDARGSVCFLVSSAVAFAEVGHRWWSWRPADRVWQISALNLAGSVFFGISAVGAYMSSGALVSTAMANGGTALGALCFLIASVLMMAGDAHGDRTNPRDDARE